MIPGSFCAAKSFLAYIRIIFTHITIGGVDAMAKKKNDKQKTTQQEPMSGSHKVKNQNHSRANHSQSNT